MPKQTKRNGLAGKLGTLGAKTFAEHKDDEVDYGRGGELPAGINNGIAQLTMCKFEEIPEGKRDAGEWRLSLMGRVHAPKKQDGIPVEGLMTSQFIKLMDTANKTAQEQFVRALNELKKLGVDTSEIEYEELEEVAQALQEEAPFFRFRTWKGQVATSGPYKGKDPLTNHTWAGTVDYDPEDSDDVDESEEEVDEDDESAFDEDPSEKVSNLEKGPKSELQEVKELGVAADDGDSDAAKALAKLATDAGVDYEAADDWGQVAQDLIDLKENDLDSESTEEEFEEDFDDDEEEEIKPEKGDVFFFKPPRKRKAVECEVTASLVKKRICNLRNLETKDLYKAVSWDVLQEA